MILLPKYAARIGPWIGACGEGMEKLVRSGSVISRDQFRSWDAGLSNGFLN